MQHPDSCLLTLGRVFLCHCSSKEALRCEQCGAPLESGGDCFWLPKLPAPRRVECTRHREPSFPALRSLLMRRRRYARQARLRGRWALPIARLTST